MRQLSFGVAATGLLALVLGIKAGDYWEIGLGIAALICAATTYQSARISSYLKVFAGIFSIETIVVGLVTIAVKAGLWPAALAAYQPPESSLEPFSITVAVFSILIYLISHLGVVRQ